MTLFAEISSEPYDFVAVLNRFYDGESDANTLKLLRPSQPTTG
jgi:uncharacterized protein (DUF1810 family)